MTVSTSSKRAPNRSSGRTPGAGIRPDPRKRLISKIHVLKAQAKLDDDTYRDMLELTTGQRSAARLSFADLEKVVTRLGEATQVSPSMVGPYAPKLRALWLSAWNLGIVRNRHDEALTAFVKRQTGLEAVRWLRDAGAAKRAIEALKSWIEREGKVDWSAHPDNPRAAIVDAQWSALLGLGVIKRFAYGGTDQDMLASYGQAVTGKTALRWNSEEDWDALIRALGNKLRFELKRTASADA
ncbi:MAG: regulatory protein GemA [Hyphomicrobiaceae bacterium]